MDLPDSSDLWETAPLEFQGTSIARGSRFVIVLPNEDLPSLYKHWEEWLEPFNTYYPWNNNKPRFKLIKDKIEYIYGGLTSDLEIDDNLLYSLLLEFSTIHNCFIHLWDGGNEEITLALAYEHLEPWMNYPLAGNNRSWLYKGQVTLVNLHQEIKDSSPEDNFLPLNRAIAQLFNHDHKIHQEISQKIVSILNTYEYGKYNLGVIFDQSILVYKNEKQYILNNPWFVGRAVTAFGSDSFDSRLKEEVVEAETINVAISLVVLSEIRAIQSSLRSRGIVIEVDILLGRIIHLGKLNLEGEVHEATTDTNEVEYQSTNTNHTGRQKFQEILISQQRLDKIVPEDESIFQYTQSGEDMDILLNQFQTILGEQDLGDMFEKEANKFYEEESDPEAKFIDEIDKIRDHLTSEQSKNNEDVDFLDFADFLKNLGQNQPELLSKDLKSVPNYEMYNDDSDYYSEDEIVRSNSPGQDVYFDEQEDMKRFEDEIYEKSEDSNDEMDDSTGLPELNPMSADTNQLRYLLDMIQNTPGQKGPNTKRLEEGLRAKLGKK